MIHIFVRMVFSIKPISEESTYYLLDLFLYFLNSCIYCYAQLPRGSPESVYFMASDWSEGFFKHLDCVSSSLSKVSLVRKDILQLCRRLRPARSWGGGGGWVAAFPFLVCPGWHTALHKANSLLGPRNMLGILKGPCAPLMFQELILNSWPSSWWHHYGSCSVPSRSLLLW